MGVLTMEQEGRRIFMMEAYERLVEQNPLPESWKHATVRACLGAQADPLAKWIGRPLLHGQAAPHVTLLLRLGQRWTQGKDEPGLFRRAAGPDANAWTDLFTFTSAARIAAVGLEVAA